MTPEDLELAVRFAWSKEGIGKIHQEVMLGFLSQLKRHAPNMHEHSLRVGLYSNQLSSSDKQHQRRLALMGGCLHDMGKCTCRQELLSGRDITLEEYEEIKNHAYQGFLLLKNDLPLSAMVAGLHHWRDGNGYGATLDDLPFHVAPATKTMLIDVVRKVATADYFDAVQTRNNKFGLDKNNPENIAAALDKEFILGASTTETTGLLYQMKKIISP